MRSIFIRQAFAMICLVFLCTACTKTETGTPSDEGANRILEFKITNVFDGPIYGVVNSNNKTITAIVPYYYYLKVWQPEIVLPTGSTVSPASGTIIDSVGMRSINQSAPEYKVTAKDGSTATYKLIVETQQPAIKLDEVTTDASQPTEVKASKSLNSYQDLSQLYLQGTNIQYENVLGIEPEVYFVDATGKEYKQYGTIGSPNLENGIFSFNATVPLFSAIPEGLYSVKVNNYSRSYTLKNKIRIVHP